MKKLLLTLVAASLLLTGCARTTAYEVATYQGKLAEGETKSDFNPELFYRNEKQTNSCDPFVLDNTERDGYYYVYGTEGSCFCYRSTDMMNWERVGNALDNLYFEKVGVASEIRKATWDSIYAPEVVYDEETDLYYMFFSAAPQADENLTDEENARTWFVMYVATSKYPYKDFKLVDYTDAASCGAENVRSYDKNAYPQYYAKYSLFDPASLAEFCKADKIYGYDAFIPSIDPHPFVDENGDKYLFWADMEGVNRMCGIKMKNWLTPDWSTATFVVWANYYDQEHYEESKTNPSVAIVPYEQTSNNCNEGPAVLEHNGKYYLSYSSGSYADSSYQVNQAVADSPLGPYRKLTEEEGGVLLSGSVAGSMEVSGTGHHSFVTVGEQLYMVYHRHDDAAKAGAARHHCIDEVKWITVKDIDGKDLEVMYINGPTNSVQPKIEAYSDYVNIADEAVVSGTEDVSYLTDGLLSTFKYGNTAFMEHIKETTITKTTTFTFDFETARAVRAIMVYNSKLENTSFLKVSDVQLVCEENGEEVVRYIDGMEFSSEFYKQNEIDHSIYYIVPGAAAYAEFDELNVKSVKITVEVPKNQEAVGISEVRILGK